MSLNLGLSNLLVLKSHLVLFRDRVSLATALVLNRLLFRFHKLSRYEYSELRVAEVLDELKSHGYQVIHSIVQSGYDIEHAVVGPAGIFAVETKFRGHGESEFLSRDGLWFGNDREENKSGRQSGCAASIRKFVKEHTGIDVCVKILVFVGDWEVKNGRHDTNTGAFTASQLEPYFRNKDLPKLTHAEIDLIGSHLESCAKSLSLTSASTSREGSTFSPNRLGCRTG